MSTRVAGSHDRRVRLYPNDALLPVEHLLRREHPDEGTTFGVCRTKLVVARHFSEELILRHLAASPRESYDEPDGGARVGHHASRDGMLFT